MGSGSIRLFRFAGIQVSLHFTWFLVAIYFISRPNAYDSKIFAVYEYLGLFVIVLLHEFGHAFATRQVGGIANQILLWPFGGIAFVQAPPRAGAQLWSIVAGPLVNLVLAPILIGVELLVANSGLRMSDFHQLIHEVVRINIVILIFNLLPIYPLDGGQILRSLLWFAVGRITSLQIASVIGLAGGALLMLYAFMSSSTWLIFITFFLLSQAITGWKYARALRLEADEATRPREPVPASERPPVI